MSSRTETLPVRGLAYNVRFWGDPAAAPMVLLHGGQDASVTFQFLVDALAGAWRVVALDWRGHGLTEWAPGGYWFQDYFADLDRLLDSLVPNEAVRLVGHSLGGHVALLYAGLRPDRVRAVVSLDGFGIAEGDPTDWPKRARRWLDGLREEPAARVYPDFAAMADRLRKTNPRLEEAKALFLARGLSGRNADGTYRWLFDPRHRLPFPTVHRFAEWAPCFNEVTAPVLWIGAESTYASEWIADRIRHFPSAEFVRLDGTGHNLHHDAPEAVAGLIEPFLRG